MMITRRQVLGGMAGLSALAAFPAHAGDMTRLSGHAFGTNWSIILPGNGHEGELVPALAAILERIDHAMSPFRADSELTAFNNATTGAFPAGPDFAHVTAEALRLADISHGAFDPTVGPLVGRYGFGPIRGERHADYAALSRVGKMISKAEATLSLDLCGIAKGYALDAVAAHLHDQGRTDFLIDIGGELLAAGMGPHHRAWTLGIANPLRGGIHIAFAVTDLAIATSGDAINAYEVAGRRYCHTIDPATGEPIRNAIASVTVAHASAMTADGLATTLLVLGPEAGPEWATAHDLPAFFLLRNSAGELDAIATPAFNDLLQA